MDKYDKALKIGNAITRKWMLEETLQDIISLSGKVRKKNLKKLAKKNSINMKKVWKRIKKEAVHKSLLR